MPYICLARNDIPDGTLQILDLAPNTSQRNASIDPPGQTRYINRALSQAPGGLTATGTTRQISNGLQSYLLDHVESGGTAAATVAITMAEGNNGDTVVFTGPGGTAVTFTAAGAADTPNGVWDTTGNAAAEAISLAAAINHANAQALFVLAFGNGLVVAAAAVGAVVVVTASSASSRFLDVTVVGTARQVPSAGRLAKCTGTVTAAAPAVGATFSIIGPTGTTVTFTAQAGGANPALQQWDQNGGGGNPDDATSLAAAINDAASQALITAALGGGVAISALASAAVVTLRQTTIGATFPDWSMASSSAATLALSGTRPAREFWTPQALAATSAAMIARVDAGLAMALADVNTILGLHGESELTNAAGSQSSGTVLDVLEILAGRSYRMPTGAQVLDAARLALATPVVRLRGGAQGTITIGTVADTNTVTINGVVFTAQNGGANPAAQQWNMNGTPTADATSLVAAINNAASQTLLVAAGTGIIARSTGAVVTLDAVTPGVTVTLATNNAAEIVLSGATMAPPVRGLFTHANTVRDTRMLGGEWRPIVRTGDVTQVENKAIRATVAGDSFQASVQSGVLSRFRTATNVLFPSSAEKSNFPGATPAFGNHWWVKQGQRTNTNPVHSARVVTVYNDDGSLA